MGIRQFVIQITNKAIATFSSGEWINGNVVLDLDEDTKARGVYLRFHGFAHVHLTKRHSIGSGKNGRIVTPHYLTHKTYLSSCVYLRFHGFATVHWTEQHSAGGGKNPHTVTRHYSNHETYFNQVVYLWGDGSRGGLFESCPKYSAGQNEYPFQFQLPQNLPSSFEGQFGCVRYYIECVVERPWKFDHKAKMPFSVNAVFDLNQYPIAKESVSAENSKTLCCLCCKSGPITNRLKMDRIGYVPGEFIVVNGEVDNESNRNMDSSSLLLQMVVTFKSTSKWRPETQTVVHLKRGVIPPGDTEVWAGERLHIPPLPPSELIHCNIIDIQYYVVLVADPAGPASDLIASCPVCIGTVPLQNTQSMWANSPFQNAAAGMMTTAPPLRPAPSASAPTADAPPPTYAQYALGQFNIRDENDKYTHGNLTYSPSYTYYSFNK